MKLDVAIEPIVTDNTAFTVLTALRQLGYAELERVWRADHLLLELSGDGSAEEVVARLSRAEIVFNPNKHRLRYAIAGVRAARGEMFEALVRDRDENNDRLVATLRTTFGIAGLRALERSMAWRLDDRAGPATMKRLEWACQALLANPISQTYEIRPAPEYRELGEPASAASKRVR